MVARGATNAISILCGLLDENTPLAQRLKIVDVMCAIDAVIWI